VLHRLSGYVGNREIAGQHLLSGEAMLGDSGASMPFGIRHHVVDLMGHHHTQCRAEGGLTFFGISFAQNTL
jgi:hypothetical protein